jgi:predicted Fe-Mo cluster-binding NifX family protein
MSEGQAPTVRGCVAVAVAEGADPSAVVSEHFGRAPRFLLFREGSDRAVQVLENARAEVPQGAGPATASLLKRHGVTAVLAGRFSPRAEDALRAGGILPVSVAPGTSVADALAEHLAGALPEAGS